MTPFHPGERQVQERAGVSAMAERVGRSIGSAMPDAAREFLRAQPFVVLSGGDGEGHVWASVVSGEVGFARALDEHALRLDALPLEGDPLREHLRDGSRVGLLAIELATRRRMRLNGTVEARDSGLLIEARQVYANCPKYIQKRVAHAASGAPPALGMTRSEALSPHQSAQIERADTFFIASLHPESGADASHRGGEPGFVRVPNRHTVRFPDYAGNAMFNTLGNLAANPRAGLLFVDWMSGATLQLAGSARVEWRPAATQEFNGAERVVEFNIEKVVATQGATAWRWELLEPSPFNPALP